MSRRDATLADGLARALLEAADAFDRGRSWRAAVLWPDPERQWSSEFDAIRDALKRRGVVLYRLGDYAPDTKTGPAIWLRCLLDTDLPGASPAPGEVPVFLLPGVSSQALRTPLTLPVDVLPLVELQYRGEVFRHRRQARDWTLGPFLRSPDQGLGLEVATDIRTDEAAVRALQTLINCPLDSFPAKLLTAEDFDRLIVSDDVRDLLVWISDPKAAQGDKGKTEWAAFRALVQKTYGVDVDAKGALQTAVEKLNDGAGAWAALRSRVDDNPVMWRAVCERLRAAERPIGLFEDPPVGSAAETERQERQLASDLAALADLPMGEAASRILALEELHRERRDNTWARLGEAPLATALEPLARLAASVRQPVPGRDVPGIAQAYADDGHAVDGALLDALSVQGPNEALIARAARALYLPWAEELATRFRQAVEEAGVSAKPRAITVAPGTCVLFVDGLRYDIGKRVADRLEPSDSVAITWRLAPVPTVTATAKPLVTPVADAMTGAGNAEQFLPLEASSGQPATTERMTRAMKSRGIQVLGKDEVVAPAKAQSIGWTEVGNLDKDGHHMGIRLAGQVPREIDRIVQRVQALRRAGWPKVHIVTDHGWLLMPGNLAVSPIAASTVDTKWSRVARLKEGAAPEASYLSWHFDDTVRIALAPGVRAFRAGEAYAHGGLSPQESVIPEIIVGEKSGGGNSCSIAELSWRRWRLSVTLSEPCMNFSVEVRRVERDPATRIAADFHAVDERRIELRVDTDVDEETSVIVVVLDSNGTVVDARKTKIGER